MNYIERIKASIRAFRNSHDFIGAESFRTRNPYMLDYCHTDEFASSYPSVHAISSEFMTIFPYTVDKNSEPVPSPVLNALYHPNKYDSSVMFFEKLAVSVLTHRKTYLLVWRRENGEAKPGGNITPQNIAGFTFLERPAVSRVDGKTYYTQGADRFNENEVIEIAGGVNPNSLYSGYSPAEASIKWATLDQYIADYQSGFFLNGAVPAGKMVVTARTSQEFNNIVDSLQANHQGAGKNNNVTYVHRPVDPSTNKPLQSQIEWIPFATANKDIDFKSVFEQANKRIDLAFGVSQVVKGVDDASTYATAQVSEAGFAKRAVKPLALRIYTQITHELNRITNGLGVAITFDYKIPAIADQEKVEAETKLLNSSLINQMVAQGYSLDSIVEAFELPQAYKNLVLIVPPSEDTDDEDVDEGGEVNASPDPNKIDGTGTVNSIEKKKIKLELTDQEKIERVARKYLKSQVDRAASEYEEPTDEVNPEPTEDELQQFVEEALAVISGILAAKGALQYIEGKKLLEDNDIDTDNLTDFILTEESTDSYRAYLKRVGDSYGKDTAESIRKVLIQAANEGLNASDTKKALRNVVNTDEWRVKRLGDTEMNRSLGIAKNDSMKQIVNQTGVTVQKSLHHPGGAQCEFCRAMEGVWVNVEQPLVGLGDSIIGEDGGILVNDFVENVGYDPHPNGRGITIYRVVK